MVSRSFLIVLCVVFLVLILSYLYANTTFPYSPTPTSTASPHSLIPPTITETLVEEHVESANVLHTFLKHLISGRYLNAVELIVDSKGRGLSGGEKNWLITLWSKVKYKHYEVLNSSTIPPHELVESPFSEAVKFTVNLTVFFKETSNARSYVTDICVVKHEGVWKILVPPIVELLKLEGIKRSMGNLLVNVDFWGHQFPKATQKCYITVTVYNFSNKTYPAENYTIKLYYAPLKVFEITTGGGYRAERVGSFRKIGEYSVEIRPSSKTSEGDYKLSVYIRFNWTIPKRLSDAYVFKATIEKMVSKEPLIAEIIASSEEHVLTFKGWMKILEKLREFERGAELRIINYTLYPDKGGLKVIVMNIGNGTIYKLRLKYYYKGEKEYHGLAEYGGPGPGKIATLQLCCGIDISKLEKIIVESVLNPEIHDEIVFNNK